MPNSISQFHEIFDELATLRPDAIAVVSRGKTRACLSYASIRERSSLLATGLKQHLAMQRSAISGVEPLMSLALQLPRTHIDFVPLMVAASRVGAPFVLLSTDLPDRNLQEARNSLALKLLRPQLCITAEGIIAAAAATADTATVTVGDLSRGVSTVGPWKASLGRQPELLCFMFTGGTQRTKCVEVTHAMVLHERVTYAELWQPSSQPAVVLAHTSVYWGASALGQLSISLAFGGTVVWTEASEAVDLRRCVAEEQVNVLGVVPDHLDLLAPESPAYELSHVEVVFTWGERLPRRTADRWRGHRAILRELLIATEYWLSFWADPLGDGAFRAVRGTKLLVLKDTGCDAAVGEIGELMMAGPMVMAGYHGSIENAPDPFHMVGKERFYRTRDLVRRVPEGFVYKGRADMMTKHKGKWVDMLAIEDGLSQLPGVRAAKVLPDPVQEHFHAFVVLEESSPIGQALNKVRMFLPPRLQLWLLPDLPRHAVTRKVDTSRLSKMLAGLPPSWPVDSNSSITDASPLLRRRITVKLQQMCCWQLVAFGTAWAVADKHDLPLQLFLVSAYLPAMAFMGQALKESSRTVGALVLTMLWVLTALFTEPPGGVRIARGVWSMMLLTYSWLTLTYADSYRTTSSTARAIMTVIDELPFWKLGAFISISLAQHLLPGPLGLFSSVALLACAVVGMVLAAWRHRLLAWPVVFWAFVVGHQLGFDCKAWIDPSFWWRNALSKVERLWSWRGVLLEPLRRLQALLEPLRRLPQALLRARKKEPATAEPAQDWPAPETQVCSKCSVELGVARWTAHDELDRVLCDACGTTFCIKAEAAAAEWLFSNIIAAPPKQKATDLVASHQAQEDTSSVLSNGSAERKAKIRRTETAAAVMITELKEQELIICTPMDQDASEVAQVDPEAAAAEQAWQREQSENWWWHNKTVDTFDLDEEEEQQIVKALSLTAQPAAVSQAIQVPAEIRLLCTVIGEIEPLLKPVHAETVLIGIDSLQVARLANAIRIQLGVSLAVQQLREAKTVAELAAAIAKAEAVAAEAPPMEARPNKLPANREYSVWYSPGQYKAMGYWVLRSDEPLDHAALVRATQALVDRHAALRAEAVDPLRYMSLLCDAAVLFTLYATFLMRGPAPMRWLQRQLSRAFARAWPRVRSSEREEFYSKRYPDTLAPLEILQVSGGQTDFERILRRRRNNMTPPGVITGYELLCHLADVWAFDDRQWNGRFVIMRAPKGLPIPEDVSLVYVDPSNNDWGPLIGPGCSQWEVPPYGFPALFYVPFSSGPVAWIRLERRDELRFCYRETSERSRWNRRMVAFRAAPQRGYDAHPPFVISFLSIGMFHCFADGNCYLPLVQDYLTLYDAARGRAASRLPNIAPAFDELERRLLDSFHCRPSPVRSSLRGSLWGFHGRGYGYCLGIGPGAVSAVTRTAVHYRVPLDIALLGVVICALARADHCDFCDFTLYTPMRDGAAEAMAVGLFSDWRDIYASVEFELATVLGTVLQLFHKIQHRQWSVFNAARKPERTVINIQPLDFEKRAGFKNLGENMWRDGDRLNESEGRTNQMGYAQQPATFVIEQQDEGTWWVLAGAGHEERPAPWMRRFVASFQDALSALLFNPLARVHEPLPDDAALLRLSEERNVLKGGPVCLCAPDRLR